MPLSVLVVLLGLNVLAGLVQGDLGPNFQILFFTSGISGGSHCMENGGAQSNGANVSRTLTPKSPLLHHQDHV